ncbi:MFS transporter, MCP family, solute carrier family 16, member 6 [Nemania sp. NC0429]|nr:MFS transporter, MCP family, solute carrier family 16, member 6 [Nemania sp. NC0429]
MAYRTLTALEAHATRDRLQEMQTIPQPIIDDNAANSNSACPSPPDGGYGWAIVAACFALNAFTWGVTASFGVYLSEYITSAKFPGTTPLEFGLVGGLNFSCAMLLAPLTTYLTRKCGLHAIVLLGSLIQCIGYISASFASQTWHLYLSQGILVGVGIGLIIVPSTAILSQWFSAKRSITNGISSAGSGVGGAAFTWGTAKMLQDPGLAWALRTTGLITLAANICAALLLRDRNKHINPTQLAFDIKLLHSRKVLLLVLWAFFSMFGYITLLFSLSDFALSIGLSRQQATDVVGLLNIGTAIGRPVIGIASDRVSRVGVAGFLTFLCGLICFALWLPATSSGLLTFFSILCGAILGVFWMTIGPLCAEIAPLKHMQSLLSISWTAIIIPTACAEVIALQLRELPSPRVYLYPQLFAGFSYLIASGFIFGLWIALRQQQAERHDDQHIIRGNYS